MYLEFRLPTVGGQAAMYANSLINKHLHAWSDQYGIPYNKKIHKYKVRVTFDDDKHYSFFALTWAPKTNKFSRYLLNYTLVEPMNRV